MSEASGNNYESHKKRLLLNLASKCDKKNLSKGDKKV